MGKKLVVCCDGTWNTPRTETNIFRTYRFLRECLGMPPEVTHKDGVRTCGGTAVDGSEVVLFYDAGVGTDWFSLKIARKRHSIPCEPHHIGLPRPQWCARACRSSSL